MPGKAILWGTYLFVFIDRLLAGNPPRHPNERMIANALRLDSPRMSACARRASALEIIDCVIELPVAATRTAQSPIEINHLIRFNGCSFEN